MILTKPEITTLHPTLTAIIDSMGHLDQVAFTNNPAYDPALYTLSAATLLTIRCNKNETVSQSAQAWLLQIETNSTDQFKFHHIQLNSAGTIGTSVKSVTLTPYQVGNNYFFVDSSGVDLTKTTYVGVEPLGAGNSVTYQSTTGQSVFSMNAGTGAITDQSTFRFGHRVLIRPTIEFIKQATTPNGFNLANELTNKDVVEIPAGTFALGPTVLNRPGMHLRGRSAEKSIISITGDVTCLDLRAANITLENFTIQGDRASIAAGVTTDFPSEASIQNLTNITTQVGVHAGVEAIDANISNVRFRNCSGYGLHLEQDGSGVTRNGVMVSNCQFFQNFVGLRATSEYNLVNHCTFGRNAAAIASYGGNNSYMGINASGNVIGIILGAGANNSHSTWLGGNLNHCDLHGIYGYDYNEGWNFCNTAMWLSKLTLRTVIGFSWVGGQIEIDPTKVDITGCQNVMIDGMRLPGIAPP